METYPLILDGAETGTVTMEREGGWTLFAVRSAMQPGIVRVSVYGEGREGYLGVLAPEGDALALRRRVSRSEMRAFPAVIAYAARAGHPVTAWEPETDQDPAGGEAQPPEEGPDCDAADGEAPPEPEKEPENDAPPRPVPEAAQAGAEEMPLPEDVYWYASPDGALVCFDGERNLIALPEGDERIPEGIGGRRQIIEGRDYIVYRTKDGRLLR